MNSSTPITDLTDTFNKINNNVWDPVDNSIFALFPSDKTYRRLLKDIDATWNSSFDNNRFWYSVIISVVDTVRSANLLNEQNEK